MVVCAIDSHISLLVSVVRMDFSKRINGYESYELRFNTIQSKLINKAMLLSTGIYKEVYPIPREVDMNNLREKANFIWSLADLILDQPPRSLEIIKAVGRALEKEIMKMLRWMTG